MLVEPIEARRCARDNAKKLDGVELHQWVVATPYGQCALEQPAPSHDLELRVARARQLCKQRERPQLKH